MADRYLLTIGVVETKDSWLLSSKQICTWHQLLDFKLTKGNDWRLLYKQVIEQFWLQYCQAYFSLNIENCFALHLLLLNYVNHLPIPWCCSPLQIIKWQAKVYLNIYYLFHSTCLKDCVRFPYKVLFDSYLFEFRLF